MIESYRNAKVIIVTEGIEEDIRCEKIVIQHLTNKNKKIEVHIRIIKEDGKESKNKEK